MVAQICVNIYASMNLVSISSGNGMSPVPHQAITWTNAGLLSIGLLGSNFSEIHIRILSFSFRNMHLNCRLPKWRTFCPEGDELTQPAGPWFNIKSHLTGIGNPIVEIRRSYDHLISIMGFPIPVRWLLYIESGLRCHTWIHMPSPPLGTAQSLLYQRRPSIAWWQWWPEKAPLALHVLPLLCNATFCQPATWPKIKVKNF